MTEPFLPETRILAVEYMRSVWRSLRPPLQVSTKSLLADDPVSELASIDPSMSVLVTVVTLRHRRLEASGRAVRQGLRASLFLRPLIPSLGEDE